MGGELKSKGEEDSSARYPEFEALRGRSSYASPYYGDDPL